MVQNVLAARAPRRPPTVGFHLELLEVIGYYRVMTALMKLEDKYPGVGANMITTFFQGKLLENEERFWKEKAEELKIRP